MQKLKYTISYGVTRHEFSPVSSLSYSLILLLNTVFYLPIILGGAASYGRGVGDPNIGDNVVGVYTPGE